MGVKVELPKLNKYGNKSKAKHGTLNAYKDYGCRCNPCGFAVSTRYMRDKPAPKPRVPKHGTLHEYHKYKCRCDKCRAVKAASAQRYKERKLSLNA